MRGAVSKACFDRLAMAFDCLPIMTSYFIESFYDFDDQHDYYDNIQHKFQ